MIKLVIIESPYSGNIDVNVEYARQCCKHAIQQGENPFASHLLYTQFLDDMEEAERALGIRLGYEYGFASLCAYHEQNTIFAQPIITFYVDLGWSKGMEAAFEHYTERGMKCEIRRINS